MAENVQRHGCGGLNIDGCRVPATDGVPLFGNGRREAKGCYSDGLGCDGRTGEVSHAGRWPANVIHDGSDEVLLAFAAFGERGDGSIGRTVKTSTTALGRINDDSWQPKRTTSAAYTDTGTAARFFYCAKASKRDRGEGNTHATVKPQALMEYLVKLVTPPGGVVIDPFMGSGSTGVACAKLGMRFVGIELLPEHFEIACRRLEAAYSLGPLFESA